MKAIIAKISILSFILLNIALPTIDVGTDFFMILKLFSGDYGCVNPKLWSEEHKQWQLCQEDPEFFCTNTTLGGSNATCERTTSLLFEYRCKDPYKWSKDYQDWEACKERPTKFCSERCGELEGNTSLQECGDAKICQFEKHPNFGISMTVPYLFNYLICFLTWWRLDHTKKKSFFFPMINIYTQLGRYYIGSTL